MTFRKSPSHVVICGPSAHPKPSQAIPDGPRMSPGGRPRSDHWALDRLWPRSSHCLRGSAVSEAPNKRPMHRDVYIVLDLEKRRLFRTDWIVILISADPSRKLGERAGEECSGDRQTDRQTDRQAGRQTGGEYGLLAAGPIRTSCHGVLALWDRPLSGALPAVQEGGRMEGLRLVSRQFRKQRLAQWAAGCGSIRTSLPWCFGSARPSFERSFAGSAGRRAKGRSETSF